MNESPPITVTCANGHQLRAPQRASGRTLPCPICREAVLVTQPKGSLSDTGVMRILGEQHTSTAASQEAETLPVPAKRDKLSDTGVMRILGDFAMNHELSVPPEEPKLRSCPMCSASISVAVSVCKNCQCYVGVSPNFMRTLNS